MYTETLPAYIYLWAQLLDCLAILATWEAGTAEACTNNQSDVNNHLRQVSMRLLSLLSAICHQALTKSTTTRLCTPLTKASGPSPIGGSIIRLRSLQMVYGGDCYSEIIAHQLAVATRSYGEYVQLGHMQRISFVEPNKQEVWNEVKKRQNHLYQALLVGIGRILMGLLHHESLYIFLPE